MKALLLAGGYATRLRPLTDTTAKPLLPIAGRPMVDWIVDRIDEAGGVEEVHLVTNAVYAADFERWAKARAIAVWNDGTRSNEDRLGALGDVALAVELGGLEGDDLLVIAADNLFEFSLRDYIAFFREKGDGSAVAAHRIPTVTVMARRIVTTAVPATRQKLLRAYVAAVGPIPTAMEMASRKRALSSCRDCIRHLA